jgi:hypothetical protein
MGVKKGHDVATAPAQVIRTKKYIVPTNLYTILLGKLLESFSVYIGGQRPKTAVAGKLIEFEIEVR